MKDLIKAQADYIKFLEAAIANDSSFLSVHGVVCTEKAYQEGIKLRADIETAHKSFGDLDIFAEELFAHQIGSMVLESEFDDHIQQIMGWEELDNIPYDNTSFDYYDHSFELYGVSDSSITLSDEQKIKLKELGFSRCWFRYSDGTEKHFYFGDKTS